MVASKVLAVILLAVACTVHASIVAAPAVHHITYHRAVPYNVLPFANSVSVFTRNLAAPALPAFPGYRTAVFRTPGFYPGLTPAIAPVAPVAPVAKVSSFLPAPFVAPAGIAPSAVPAPVAPVAHSVQPVVAQGVAPGFAAGVAPAVAPAYINAYANAYPAQVAPAIRAVNPYFPGFVPAPINPAIGRSIHAVAPAPAIAQAVPLAHGVPVDHSAPVAAPPHYIGK